MPHIVSAVDRDLEALEKQFIDIAKRAMNQVWMATDALRQRDPKAKSAVEASDRELDEGYRKIEEKIFQLTALRQPMAVDLRVMMAVMRGGRDVERIGDYAKNMSRHVATLAGEKPSGIEKQVLEMAGVVQGMLKHVIEAFEARDLSVAEALRRQDAEVDERYTKAFAAMLQGMAHEPSSVTNNVHLLLVARCLERIGDHVTNLADDIRFLARGEFVPDDREKRDTSFNVVADDD